MNERQIKNANKLKDGLINDQQKAGVIKIKPKKSEVIKAIEFIKNEIINFNESKLKIIEKLAFLKNNQEKLIEETGKTFNELIVEITGFSKSYFYQLVGNYEFLDKHNRTDLIDKVDTGVITNLKKIENPQELKKLLNKANTLTRKDFAESDMSDSDKISPEIIKEDDNKQGVFYGTKKETENTLYYGFDDTNNPKKEIVTLTQTGFNHLEESSKNNLKYIIRNHIEKAMKEFIEMEKNRINK
jgi:hypothetical protein